MAETGLSSSEAARRLHEHGPNELQRAEGTNPVLLFVSQLKNPMIILLAVAAVVSGVLGEVPEAVAIVAIVLLNAIVGFVQEFRAEKAVLALRSMTAPRARVLRDGASVMVPATEVVPGDVLLLEGGDIVAADATLLEANRFTTIEAALTGESAPVEKDVEPVPDDTPLAERTNHIFMGTSVADGSGRALVSGTGAKTELGKIANLLETATEQQTPLQQQLSKVGRSLVWLCLGVVVLVAVVGVLRKLPPLELLVSSISLAVAAVPEGLAAIVTIALAIGVQRMASRHVLVRKLPAVEALGSTTVICTDKTGTLTRGVMSLRETWGADERALVLAAASCCDAELKADGTGVGDPTEVAILEKARQLGIERDAIEHDNPRKNVWPFDSKRKRMSVLRADGTLFVKGALELVLPVSAQTPEGVEAANTEQAKRGLRVLAVAVRKKASSEDDPEHDLQLLGLLGLADPPREEAELALAQARQAGVRTVMMTGDNLVTATAIATELGLLQPGESAEGRVYARVTPEQKLTVIRELKAKGEVVAMTGDGTNDAPALKEAHVGIAMGKTGVEVTREAADMVLSDDNFASIVAAIREGRAIYDNIRKTLIYLLGGNVAELVTTLVASLVGWPLPLLALHLLWVNLVTDGLPALALVMDPANDEVLKRTPRPPDEPMLGRRQWAWVLGVGGLVSVVSLLAFWRGLAVLDLPHARTLVFSVLVFAQVFNALAFRSAERVSLEVGLFSNPRLLLVMVGTIALHVGLVAFPPSARLFELGAFDWKLMLVALGLGLVPVTVIELSKLVRRAVSSRKTPES